MRNGKRTWIKSVAGETLGLVGPDIFSGFGAWVPYRDGWVKVAVSKQTLAMARQAVRNWHDMRPDQQATIADRNQEYSIPSELA